MIRNSLVMLAAAFLLGFGVAGSANAERSAPVTLWSITSPDVEGKDRLVRFTFIKNGIHVYQRCLPFLAVWGQGDKVQIKEPENRVMCVATPLHEITTVEFFARLKIYYPSGHDSITLMTIDNELIEATRVGPTPEEGQIIWN